MKKYFVFLKNRNIINWSLWLYMKASKIDQYLHAIVQYKLELSVTNSSIFKWFNTKHVSRPNV